MKKRVAVGLSGGIDSSFAAYLLNRKGWDVTGFTLKFYPQENRCCDLDSLYEAQRLCHKLDIPHYVIDVGDLFKEEIVDYFIKSYLGGLTPNPCALCNRLIKFGYFFKKIQSLGIDYLSTGHYARIIKKGEVFFLNKARDKKKSQEYFLSLIKPQILKQLIFPLGNYTKEEVRKVAQREKIIFKNRKESQDVCFVKEKPYTKFIEKHIASTSMYEGDIRHIKGDMLGKHKGIYYYTYGQRQGLGISWKEPLYVIAIDSETKTVIVGEKKYLYRDRFTASCLNWFVEPKEYLFSRKLAKAVTVKVRYNSPFYNCSVSLNGDKAVVLLKEGIAAITPGQIATFYHRDNVLGGGIIEKNGFP
jgi:tRNA-specific 2-thiouridylase